MRVSATERKEQLIRATVELMREEGVQNLNLRAIADRAGASLATVHYCFDGKDDLLTHAVEYWLRRMVELPDLDDAAMAFGLPAVAQRIAGAFWSALEDNPDDVLAQIELVTWSVRQAPKKPVARRIYRSYETTLGGIFNRALSTSGQSSTWEPGDLARAWLVLVDGASLQYMADPTSERHKQTFERMLALVFESAVSVRDSKDEVGRALDRARLTGRESATK
jgi:AcrR family transcriptional regulator